MILLSQAGIASFWRAFHTVLISQGRRRREIPTGAGILALETHSTHNLSHPRLLVCIVENRSGKRGLPKGGQELPETLRDTANREWLEEVNTPHNYLFPLIWGDNSYWDDGYLGIR